MRVRRRRSISRRTFAASGCVGIERQRRAASRRSRGRGRRALIAAVPACTLLAHLACRSPRAPPRARARSVASSGASTRQDLPLLRRPSRGRPIVARSSGELAMPRDRLRDRTAAPAVRGGGHGAVAARATGGCAHPASARASLRASARPPTSGRRGHGLRLARRAPGLSPCERRDVRGHGCASRAHERHELRLERVEVLVAEDHAAPEHVRIRVERIAARRDRHALAARCPWPAGRRRIR